MSSSRTPTHKTATKLPSFASCFGATIPVSPRRERGQASLAGHTSVNYRRLQFEEFEDEAQCGFGVGATECQDQERSDKLCKQGGPSTMKLGKHSSFKEKPGMKSETLYASEGEQEVARERTGGLKLGIQRAMRKKAGSGRYSASETFKKKNMYESEEENCEYGRKTKLVVQEATTKKAEAEAYDNNAKLRVKTGSKREKACKEGFSVEVGDSPRRASFGTKMREACVHVLETARRGSPHLSELFVGNQLLMQVTASSFNSRHAKRMAPSYGFHVFTTDPSMSVLMSSPAHSTSSAF